MKPYHPCTSSSRASQSALNGVCVGDGNGIPATECLPAPPSLEDTGAEGNLDGCGGEPGVEAEAGDATACAPPPREVRVSSALLLPLPLLPPSSLPRRCAAVATARRAALASALASSSCRRIALTAPSMSHASRRFICSRAASRSLLACPSCHRAEDKSQRAGSAQRSPCVQGNG